MSNVVTYFELIKDMNFGLRNPNITAYRVLNSDDTRLYVFKDGDFVSEDEGTRFEDLYKNCDLLNIKLEELIKEDILKQEIYDKDKYYTEEEFLDEEDYANFWDDTPKEVAHKQAIIEVIKTLEKLYIDLDMDIDACQGAMANLNQAFEELDIYKDLISYLGGDLEKDRKQLVEDYFKEAREQREAEEMCQLEKDKIIKKLDIDLVSLMQIKNNESEEEFKNAIIQSFFKVQEKINEIRDIIINIKKS